ncbi:MAG: ParB/RepB/Spo0J family partition protein [Dehalococcoidia bacterium]|nr:ParB/RepB/Spo0J family partition protein [Dehalococcoidia bacterium]
MARGLGRGLAALIPEAVRAPDARIPTTEVAIDRIVVNPWQPRTVMNAEALAELAASIRKHGIIQPLLVSEEATPDGAPRYQLIAGERRLRAATAAGLTHVPVTVRQSTPQELLELALIENVQRADLGPLEEAQAYERLVREFGLTQQQVAERVGKSRAAVANTLRLNQLPEELRASLARGEFSEGHARALLGVSNVARQRRLWRAIVDEQLSVREAEQHANDQAFGRAADAPPGPDGARSDGGAPGTEAPAAAVSAEQLALADALRRALGTKVTLRRSRRGSGTLTIHFFSDDELEGVLDRLGVHAT